MKRVAVRQHGQAWRKRPRRLPGRRAYERKCPPEENQDTRGNDNLLCRGESENVAQTGQRNVARDVVPLPREVKPWSLAALDELREPRVINVTRQVASLDAPVPKAREEQRNRRCSDTQPARPQKRQDDFHDPFFLYLTRSAVGLCFHDCPCVPRTEEPESARHSTHAGQTVHSVPYLRGKERDAPHSHLMREEHVPDAPKLRHLIRSAQRNPDVFLHRRNAPSQYDAVLLEEFQNFIHSAAGLEQDEVRM